MGEQCFFLKLDICCQLLYCIVLYCRCVRDEQRSFALGIQWIKVRVLGTIPAPMVIGLLIDRTCLLWHETSGSLPNGCTNDILETGACQLYHNREMGR